MRPLTTEHIMAATVAQTGVTREELAARLRAWRFVHARWAFVYVCRTANASPIVYSDIARELHGVEKNNSVTVQMMKRASELADESFDFWSLCDDITEAARKMAARRVVAA